MTPEQLRAAAERAYNWYVTPNVEDAHRNMPDHVFYTGWQAIKHILATVHPEDAEPVTVEKMVAMGAVEWPAGRELYWPKTRLRYAMDIGWKDDTGFYVLNDNGHVVYLRDTKTMGQLRHLLAGLGMGGGN